MARAYDTRPDLAGYDALTLRGIAKFVGFVILLFGADYLARRYGVQRWLLAAIQLAWAALGFKLIWSGSKAFKTGEHVSPEAAEPRYSERNIQIISPRVDAGGAILVGALLVFGAAERIIQISQGAN